ncbi:MAG: hypothetical protein K6B40_00850, partial [Firmicutes bacterium]|nr:hypothetical protein [Bacillota bacterium]
MKKSTKLLALLFSVLMLFGLLPAAALADDAYSFKVSSNETAANALFEYYYGDDDDCEIEYEDDDVSSVDIAIDKTAIDSEHGDCPF